MAFRFSCELTLTERPYQTGLHDTGGNYHVYDGVDSTWKGTVYQLFPEAPPADVCNLHTGLTHNLRHNGVSYTKLILAGALRGTLGLKADIFKKKPSLCQEISVKVKFRSVLLKVFHKQLQKDYL